MPRRFIIPLLTCKLKEARSDPKCCWVMSKEAPTSSTLFRPDEDDAELLLPPSSDCCFLLSLYELDVVHSFLVPVLTSRDGRSLGNTDVMSSRVSSLSDRGGFLFFHLGLRSFISESCSGANEDDFRRCESFSGKEDWAMS